MVSQMVCNFTWLVLVTAEQVILNCFGRFDRAFKESGVKIYTNKKQHHTYSQPSG